MYKHIGKQTVVLENPPSIISAYTVVGPKESEGPLGEYFDVKTKDILWEEETWEKAESKFAQEAIKGAIEKANIKEKDIQYIFAGDLLNQLVGTSFGVKDFDIPYFGLFGACSTMGESLSLGSMIIDGGFAKYVVASTSSHYGGAEKQFRFPLALGTQKPLTAQWTVTGSGALILGSVGEGPYITSVTTGKIIDLGISDGMNMGAAMAPAAADTIVSHLKDSSKEPGYYDMIITGDLGEYGLELLIKLVEKEGYDIRDIAKDCGVKIFDDATQDTHAGASGCGCSAVVLGGYLYKKLKQGKLNKILFVATGALLSSSSSLQGETIPSIAHAVSIERSIKKRK